MLIVTEDVRKAYGDVLINQGIAGKDQYAYQKWLRFYLDFCHKYQHAALSAVSVEAFLRKLEEKNQPEDIRDQANSAVALYLSSFGTNVVPKKTVQINTSSGATLMFPLKIFGHMPVT